METMRVGRLLGLWLDQQMESSMVKPLARLTQDSETGTYSTAIRLGSLSVHLTQGFGKASLKEKPTGLQLACRMGKQMGRLMEIPRV